MVLWQDKVAGQHKHRLLWELSYVQVVVTHEIYSTPVVRRTENSLCSFSEPRILSHFTLGLPIRKKLKDTTLIYNTYWNTALSQRSCVPNCEGHLRDYQYNTTRAAHQPPSLPDMTVRDGTSREHSWEAQELHTFFSRQPHVQTEMPLAPLPVSLHGANQLGVIQQHNVRNVHS